MFINLVNLPLGKQILIKRIIHDVGQIELANALGMNNAILSRVENGKQELPKKYQATVEQFLKN